MKRVTERLTDKAVVTVCRAAWAGVSAITLAIGMSAGAAMAQEKPVARTARLDKPEDSDRQPAAGAKLFGRATFDPGVIRNGDCGGFLIRVGEIFRDPRLALFVPFINAAVPQALTTYCGKPIEGFDVTEIEWIAGNFRLEIRPAKKGGQPCLLVGWQYLTIRLNRSAKLQEAFLANVAGASLKTFHDKSYVELPPLPQLGMGKPVLRFADEMTIVGLFEEPTEEGLEWLFDDSLGVYDWAKSWQRADGGLVTLVVDNRDAAWRKLQGNQLDLPQLAWPAIENPDYFGIGLDWNHQTDRVAIRVDSFCDERLPAEQAYDATREMLTYLKKLCSQQAGDPNLTVDTALQALQSAQVRLGGEQSEPGLVEATTEFSFSLPSIITGGDAE